MKFYQKSLLFFSSLMAFSCISLHTADAHYALITEMNIVADDDFGGAYLQFANKMGGKVSKEAIAAQKELGVAGCAAGSRIFQFTLYITKDGKRTSYTSKSHILSKEITSALWSLSVGDEFEFKRIKAYLPKKDGIVDVHSNKFVVV